VQHFKTSGHEAKMAKKIRPIRTEENIAFVPLTRGLEAIIDAADVHMVESYNWCAMPGANTVYAMRLDNSSGTRSTIYLHRVISAVRGREQVDHINSNGLDNRRLNLRAASCVENMRNTKLQSSNTSGYKGVHWLKSAGKWQARIRTDLGRRHLGLFTDPKDAYSAYCEAAKVYHGNFARLK